MRVGVPKEIKTLEFRVGLTPGVVRSLVNAGHTVAVETGAGAGVGLSDGDYQTAGATIAPSADAVFAGSDMIVKVKEPLAVEIARLRPDHILFTYLHLAADKDQTLGLMKSGCTAIAYETITDAKGGLPLLAPMSQVAGRMATQVGAAAMLKPAGGRGMLLGGVPGVPPAKVVILGGGVSGRHAAEIAIGMRADVTLFDISAARLEELDGLFVGRLKTAFSTPHDVAEAVAEADLVIGCVLLPGAAAPKLVSRADLKRMKKGSVLVDVAIDQGGCFETSHPTTHADPTYTVHESLFYCVANMPGAVAHTSTYALTNATLPYVRSIANLGWAEALRADPALALGLNVHGGQVVNAAVAAAQGLEAGTVAAAIA
jgi:alanine dehydrogenase